MNLTFEYAERIKRLPPYLFAEIEKPHLILNALSQIIQIDPEAIYASRILESVPLLPPYRAPGRVTGPLPRRHARNGRAHAAGGCGEGGLLRFTFIVVVFVFFLLFR